MNTVNDLLRTLGDIPSRYSACYTWDWNAKITHEETARQIDALAEADIRSICILPEPAGFRPTFMKTELEPEYLSDAFFDEISYAVDYAASKGITVWLYDEGGWPSGGACRQTVGNLGRDFVLKRYLSENITLKKGEIFRLPEPTEYRKPVCAFLRDGSEKVADGAVFDEDTELTYFFIEVSGDDYRANIIDRRVTDKFIEITHDRYFKATEKHFGKTIPLIFDDEANVASTAYCDDIEKQFSDRYGYSLTDHLPAILETVPCLTEEQKKAHRDYRLLLGDLLCRNFFTPIRDWCRAHGIASAGHLNHDHTIYNSCICSSYSDPVKTLRCFDIPGVDVIWGQVWDEYEGREGVDPFFPRFASSAAAQNGDPEALTEFLGVYGDGLTSQDILWIVNQFAVRGINLFTFLNMSYGKDKFYLGLERPVFDPAKPGFSDLSRLNTVLGRISALLHFGRPDVKTAVYMPICDLASTGETADQAKNALCALANNLEARHIDFDFINDSFVTEAHIENGSLTNGNASYSSVFVPECAYMPKETAEKLGQLPHIEPLSLISADSDNDGLMARKLVSGRESVVYIVNTLRTDFRGQITVHNPGKCFVFDLSDGKVYPAECEYTDHGAIFGEVTIPSGHGLALLFADHEIKTEVRLSGKPDRIVTVDSFDAVMESETLLTEKGIVKKTAEAPERKKLSAGRWFDAFGEEFSGTVCYRFSVTLDFKPDKNTKCVLKAPGLENTARVCVNEKNVGILAFPSDEIIFTPDSAELNIKMHVSNSFANQLAAVDAYSFFEKAIVGCYHDRSLRIEKMKVGGGITEPVEIGIYR